MSRRADSRADLRRMLAVLVQENAALRAADLARLGRLAPRKAALLTRLQGATAEAANGALLDRVRQLAGRNAQLYEAVIAGIGDARRALEQARNPASTRAYARGGQRFALEPPVVTMERRA
jgi:hypothetical protein